MPLKYLILCIAAIFIFPSLLFFVRRSKVDNWVFVAAVAGFWIAAVGLLMQDVFGFLAVLAVLFGLSFAFAVFIDQRAKRVNQTTAVLPMMEKAIPSTADVRRRAAAEEVAASLEKDVITLQPIEDDLGRWMAADRQEISIEQQKEEGRSRFNGE